MAQNRIDNFNITANKHIDNRVLKNGTDAWASTLEAHNTILYKYRYLTVVVNVNGQPVEYWYKDAFASVTDLVVKNPGATVDLKPINDAISTKANLPDGLSVIGQVSMNINTATVTGFEAVYNGNHITLASAQVVLDAKDATYDRIDSIYYDPVANVYGKVTGIAIQNPVKPIPVIPIGSFRIADVRRNVDGTNVVTYAPLNGYVTLNGPQSIFGEKRFNDGLSSDRELLDVRKPINNLWPIGFYVNYDNAFHNNSVLFVDDPASYFKKVIKVPLGMSRLQPHAIYGPYVSNLPAGDWVYEFQLKVSNNTITTPVIQFDIAVGGFTWGTHYLNIAPNSFPDTTSYQTFRMPFTATKGTTYEFRVHTLVDVNPLDFYFNFGIARPAVVPPAINLAGISDVLLNNPSDGQVLKYNATTGKWYNGVDNVGSGSGGGDMFKVTYDANGNGVVDDSEKLNGQAGNYYRDLGNSTGTLTNPNDITVSDATKGFVLKCGANGLSYRLAIVLNADLTPTINLVQL